MSTSGVLAAAQRVFCTVIMDGEVYGMGRSVAIGETRLSELPYVKEACGG